MGIDIRVAGDGNRVAGRDYYELHAVITLTFEDLRTLTIGQIVPCPRCEKRVIQPSADSCQHCLEQQPPTGRLAFLKAIIWSALRRETA